MKKGSQFTHFGSIPFITEQMKSSLANLLEQISSTFAENQFYPKLIPNNPNFFHLTLFMLTMPEDCRIKKAKDILEEYSPTIKEIMMDVSFKAGEVKYFLKKDMVTSKSYVSLIYLDLIKDESYEKFVKLTDLLIRVLLKEEMLGNNELKDMHIYYDHNKALFKNEEPHITLFRCEDLEQNEVLLQNYSLVKNIYLDNILKCNFVDLSTKSGYDNTNVYTPLARVIIQEENQNYD